MRSLNYRVVTSTTPAGLHLRPCSCSLLLTHPYELRAGDWRLAGGNLQQLTLQFPALLRSSVTVSIEFSYPLRDALSGFYRSTFSSEREARVRVRVTGKG